MVPCGGAEALPRRYGACLARRLAKQPNPITCALCDRAGSSSGLRRAVHECERYLCARAHAPGGARNTCATQAAATGWAWVGSGAPLFPGYLSIEQGVTFESVGRYGYAAWDAVPESGKFQILGIIGILELLGEAAVKPHYMKGGIPGKIPLL